MATKTFSIDNAETEMCFQIAYDDASEVAKRDDIVSKAKSLEVELNYPLTGNHRFTVKTRSAKGFTRQALVSAIQKLYTKVYADENRYGIWGHDIGDLVLEAVTITDKGFVTLSVGS